MNYIPDKQAGFVTTAWVRNRYSISNSTLYLWTASGILPPLHRIGPRAVRYRLQDLLAFEAKFATRDGNNR